MLQNFYCFFPTASRRKVSVKLLNFFFFANLQKNWGVLVSVQVSIFIYTFHLPLNQKFLGSLNTFQSDDLKLFVFNLVFSKTAKHPQNKINLPDSF